MTKKLSILLFIATMGAAALAQDAPLYTSETFSLYPRMVVEEKHHADIVADNALTSTLNHKKWIQSVQVNKYPQFSCDIPVSNTLYNLSLEELSNLWGKDNCWHASTERDAAWTHDIGYATLLTLALTDANAAQTSLMKRVNNGRVMQDAGTGGSWPVATDRAVWVLGAWEVYLTTGDKQWLKQCYEIVRHMLEQDERMLYDKETGLVRGEMSLPNCRKEVYPEWMQPTDIAQSECLSTNALFFRANEIAAIMAKQCGDGSAAEQYRKNAERIKNGINTYLWLEEKGYYGQYLYGHINLTVSPRFETLGEAMCILFGIANPQRAQRIIHATATTPYGTPCFSPQIPDVYNYHNNAVWPYIQAYWMWAAAQTGDPQAVTYSMACIYRPTALMATNMENVQAERGTAATASNSPNSLLSVAANLSIPTRILAGIKLTEEGMRFAPLVPRGWANKKTVSNIKYRKAVLDITIQGFGDKVAACYLDGKRQKEPMVPASISGKHSVRLVMNEGFTDYGDCQPVAVSYSPRTAKAWFDGATRIAWQPVEGVQEYKILRNGKVIARQPESLMRGNYYDIPDEEGFAEYQIVPVDSAGEEGFASKPLTHYGIGNERQYDMATFATPTTNEKCKGYSGKGAVEITSTQNTRIDMEIEVPASGDYLVDLRYVNGSGSPTEGDGCASRMLWVNGKRTGAILFPQQGNGIWHQWEYSTPIRVHLGKGVQKLVLIYELDNVNMNAKSVNRAMLDYLRLIPLQ